MVLPSRARLLLGSLLGLWAAAWLGVGSGGCTGTNTPAPITLTDRDGNGLPDLAIVADFDGDGILEIDDIQDAMDALTDPGPKLVRVQAGTYQPPANPGARAGRTHALLELRSFSTLKCTRGVILRGTPLTAGRDYAVVANDDHNTGNDEVRIEGCEIHGGASDSYNAASFPKTRRMGVYFRRTRNSAVVDSYVHHTVHTGLYTSNSSGDQFLRNRVEDAGGYGDTSGGWRQPCIYLFAFGGGSEVSDFVAADNVLRRCGHSGLNTRANDQDAPGDVVRNMLWERNTVEDALSQCINLRGVAGAIIRGLTCRRSGAIHLNRGFGTGYRFSGNDSGNDDVLIEDSTATAVRHGQAGIDIGAWVDGLTLRRVRVEGTRDETGAPLSKDCVWLERPLRGTVIEDLTVRDCGARGVLVTSLPGGLGDASETLTLRRVEVSDVDQAGPIDTALRPGIEFAGAHARLWLEDLTLSGATAPELLFGGAVTQSTLRRIAVDSVDPGWLGAFFESTAPACNASREGRWLTSLNGTSATDCIFAPGSQGGVPARCGCSGGLWAPIYWAASPGIEFPSGALHSNVLLEDVSVKNARNATGVRVRGLLSNFAIVMILGADDSLATNVDQRSAADFDATSGFTVTGASCVGTQPAVPCIE